MFGDDMCEDMCVWRRYVSEYVCWPTVPPISRCSEANVWTSRMVQPPSSTVRLEVRCTRTHGNHSPTMYSARQRTGRTAPRTRTPLNAQGHRARQGISALTTLWISEYLYCRGSDAAAAYANRPSNPRLLHQDRGGRGRLPYREPS